MFLNLLANDTDVDGDLQVATFTAPLPAVTRSGTGLRYPRTPATRGRLARYTVIDGHGGSDTAVVNITVTDSTRPTLGGVGRSGSTSQDFKAIARAVLPGRTSAGSSSRLRRL